MNPPRPPLDEPVLTTHSSPLLLRSSVPMRAHTGVGLHEPLSPGGLRGHAGMRNLSPVLRMPKIALCMGLADSWEHGIAAAWCATPGGGPRAPPWYGWMFRPSRAWRIGTATDHRPRGEPPRRRPHRAPGAPVVDVPARTCARVPPGHERRRGYGSHGRALPALLRLTRFAYAGVRAGAGRAAKAGLPRSPTIGERGLPSIEEPLPWWEGRAAGRLPAWVRSLAPAGGDLRATTPRAQARRALPPLRLRVPEESRSWGWTTRTSLRARRPDAVFRRARPRGHRVSGGGPARGAPDPSGPLSARARDHTVASHPDRGARSTSVFTCEDAMVEQAVRFIRASVTRPSRWATWWRRCRAHARPWRSGSGGPRQEHPRGDPARAVGARTDPVRSTDDRVADIALECGYRTPQRFHEVFRAVEGVSPARSGARTAALPP